MIEFPHRNKSGREAPVFEKSLGDLSGFKTQNHFFRFAPGGKLIRNTVRDVIQRREIGVSEGEFSEVVNQAGGVGRRGIGQLHFRSESLSADCNTERVAAKIAGFPTVAPHGMNEPATCKSGGRDPVENFAAKPQDGVGDIFAALVACEVGGICSSQNIGGKTRVQVDEHFHLTEVRGTPLRELEELGKNSRSAGDGTRHFDDGLEVSGGFHQRINSGLEGIFTMTSPVWLFSRIVRFTRPLTSHETTSNSISWLIR